MAKKVSLCFVASQNEPDLTTIFLTAGGQINAAAARWDTDFAVTGSTESSVSNLNSHNLREVRVAISDKHISFETKTGKNGDDVDTVIMDASMRLNVSTSRIGTAINGTLVSTVAGQGSEYISQILKPGKSHSQIGLVYSSWAAHAASVGISNARIVSTQENGTDVECDVLFRTPSVALKSKLSEAAKIVNTYVQIAWSFREQLVYEASPTLTKTVFKEVVGVDAQGYSLVHDIVQRGAPMSLETLDSMFEACIRQQLDHNPERYAEFMQTTERAGFLAAAGAKNVASATSLLVTYLVSYRVDGRNLVSAMGSSFAPAESWLRQTARDHIEANDCDGSALLAVGVLTAASGITETQEKEYKHLLAIKNVISPHYSVGVSIVGASAAEATSADGAHANVAGHAIALLMPNLHLLRALSRSAEMQLAKTGAHVIDENRREHVANARFDAFFPKNVVKKLSDYDRNNLKSWKDARDLDKFKGLHTFAIEGTTPADSLLYVQNAKDRRDAQADVERDDVALAKASPNVFRSVKMLHVGGSTAGSTHRFYRDLVEVTFPRSFPLWKNEKMRNLSLAATQYVFSRPQAGDAITTVGASPRDIHEQTFLALPLVNGMDKNSAETLDLASTLAEHDVIPPRPKGPMTLTEFQTKCLKTSMKHLRDLENHFVERSCKNLKDVDEDGEEDDDSHCVTYTSAYSTLVHNPEAVLHFCKTIEALATDGCVDIQKIKGMAQWFEGTKEEGEEEGEEGEEAGFFVSINAYIPV
jgi:hypothetical protein